MRIVWDQNKNRSNQVKHRVSFEAASLVFEDPFHLSILDRIENGEERWQTLGIVGGGWWCWSRTPLLNREARKSSVSSRPARRHGKRGKSMKKTAKEPAEDLAALAALPDEEIDTSDIPEITDWSKAVVGRFYRPVKETVTIRLDADVLDWLKQGGKGYQTRVNKILRAIMEQQRKKAA